MSGSTSMHRLAGLPVGLRRIVERFVGNVPVNRPDELEAWFDARHVGLPLPTLVVFVQAGEDHPASARRFADALLGLPRQGPWVKLVFREAIEAAGAASATALVRACGESLCGVTLNVCPTASAESRPLFEAVAAAKHVQHAALHVELCWPREVVANACSASLFALSSASQLRSLHVVGMSPRSAAFGAGRVELHSRLLVDEHWTVSLARFTALKEIRLTSVDLSDGALAHVLGAVERSGFGGKLALAQCNLAGDDATASRLGFAARELRGLRLSFDLVGDAWCGILTEMLFGAGESGCLPASRLEQLTLGQCMQDGGGRTCAVIAQALVSPCCALVQLDLQENALRSKDCRALFEALAFGGNCTLRALSLAGNCLCAESGSLIGQALEASASITSLDLSSNALGDDGVAPIAEALRTSTVLWDLNLSSLGLGEDSAVALANAIRLNRALISLNVSLNSLGDFGCLALCDSVVGSVSRLRSLNMRYNDVSEEGQRLARQTLEGRLPCLLPLGPFPVFPAPATV